MSDDMWNAFHADSKSPEGYVKVMLRDGSTAEGWAADFKWSHLGVQSDIIGYVYCEEPKTPDMVSSPPHYTKGGIECIDAIRSALTVDEFRGHCKANAMKYIWREAHKGQDESIRKAIWYLEAMLK